MNNNILKENNKDRKKEYWTQNTEEAVKEYLKNDFNFYQYKIEKHIEDVNKSIEKNRKNSKFKVIELNEDFLRENEIMIDKTSHPSIIMKKEEIFRKHIYKPLTRLVENIIFSFKLFRSGVDIKTLHNDCMSHIIEKFCNFDPDQNTKSFSFYGTVAKHYLQNKKKEVDKNSKIDLFYDDFSEEANEVFTFEIDEENDLESSLSLFNYIIESFYSELKNKEIVKNDAKVVEAIVDIFKNHEILKIYPKTAVYKLIKEHTNLETKEITYSLSRLRAMYKNKKQKFIQENKDNYYNDEIDEEDFLSF